MASSSSGSNAYGNAPFGASSQAFNAEEFDLSAFERRDDEGTSNLPNLNAFGPSDLAFDEFANFGGGLANAARLAPDMLAGQLGGMHGLDSFAFDFRFGQQGLSLDPSSMVANPDLDMFVRHEAFSIGSPLEFGSLSGAPANSITPFSSSGMRCSALQSTSFRETSSTAIGTDNTGEKNRAGSSPASVSSELSTFPEHDPELPTHSSFEEDSLGTSPRSAPSKRRIPHNEVVETSGTATDERSGRVRRSKRTRKVSVSIQRRSSPVASDTTADGQTYSHLSPQKRGRRTHVSRKGKGKEKAKETKSKAKQKAQEHGWHVITAPTLEAGPSGSSPMTGSNTEPVSMPSGSSSNMAAPDVENSANSSTARPKQAAPRKEIFQTVDPSKTGPQPKPGWFTTPPPSEPDPDLYKPKPRKNPLKPGTHSDLGWVLAKVRVPNSNPSQHAWYAAQVHDPWNSVYLILCGPYQFSTITVRCYDRIAYSTDNIAMLEEHARRQSGARVERVYANVTVDPVELARRSSAFATDLAAGAYDNEGRMQSTTLF